MTRSSTPRTTKWILTGRPSTLLAYVFSVVIVPLIFPHSDRQAVWNAIRVLLLGNGRTGHNSLLSSQQQQQDHHQPQKTSSLSTTPETQQRRPLLSPMEQKFYISRIPHVSWHKSSLSLEYTMAEWVTPAVIQHKLFEWDCQTELLPAMTNANENSSTGTVGRATSIWNARPPEQLVSNTGPADDESVNFATQRWQLTLDLDTGRFGFDEKDPTSTIISNPYSFCVRWMLYNLPIGHEYSMEVTFQRTQLSVHYSRGHHQSHDSNSDDDSNTDSTNNDFIQIERVDVSIPEEPTIAINVNGRGRAIVHREL